MGYTISWLLGLVTGLAAPAVIYWWRKAQVRWGLRDVPWDITPTTFTSAAPDSPTPLDPQARPLQTKIGFRALSAYSRVTRRKPGERYTR